ncbi:MAG: hypothetical protein GF330_04090 [Candidatus Eisenbacteria bacterium]|nr:hypothetical protein [Candidatus Eisenbacteria bacterium]
MHKSPIFYAAALLLVVGAWGCSDSSTPATAPAASDPSIGAPVTLYLEDPCGEPLELGMITRRQEEPGRVTVANDTELLQVTFDTRGTGWVIAKSRLFVRTLAPSGKHLRPARTLRRGAGERLSGRHDPPVTLYSYDLALSDLGVSAGDRVVVSARAVVQMLDEEGHPVRTAVAWAVLRETLRPRWSFLTPYEIQACEEPDPCSVAVTYPNGGEFFCVGWQVEVLWDSSQCGAEVMIELLWDGEPCTTIATSAPNSGSYSWYAAPCTWETEGYAIRVTDLESGAYDDSDQSFVIGECGE